MTTRYPATPATTPTRHRDRAAYDREAVHRVLDEALLCHVAHVVDGRPTVLPTLHARVGERLYLHASTGARLARAAAEPAGVPVCVTTTVVDALVLARSAMHHSMNYRSVVVHGRAVLVREEAEKRAALAAVVDAVVPGRSGDCREPSAKELAATAVLAVDLLEVSAKVRAGGPADDAEDLAGPHWAGVVPLRLTRGEPVPAADLRADVSLPTYL
ncbi:MAG TPA: pyridoxamine 5'-phosphate oxidase family protein [Motilibacteraceae bacterium]|nr:pyridoxamine 5'-phosphate oxidase family protein [Motilibacteraceae bacterium]